MPKVLELEYTKAAEDFRLLARDVNKLIPEINSLMNMSATLEGKTRGVGQLEMRGDRSFLRMFITPGGFGPTIPTSINLTASKNPSSPGDSITWTAIVIPSISVAVSATGTIQFYIDGTAFGSPVTLVNGQATSAPNTTIAIGDHAIAAHYSGNDDFFPSDASLTQTVKYATTLAIVSSANPATIGQSVHFTATLSGTNISSATGTIQFYIDGTAFGAAVNVAAGQAVSGSITWQSTGSHNIQAHYSGDSQFMDSDAPTLSESVGDFPASFTVSGPATNQLTGTYSYTITGNISYTGKIRIFTPYPTYTNLVGEYHSGGSGAYWQGFPQINVNGARLQDLSGSNQTNVYPVDVDMVAGSATISIRSDGGASINYAANDFAIGSYYFGIKNPYTNNASTVNGSGQQRIDYQ